MKKPHYRVKLIQDLCPGDVVYDEKFKRHIKVSEQGVYQEGHINFIPVWKFAYQCIGHAFVSRAVAYALEGEECFVYSLSLQSEPNQ